MIPPSDVVVPFACSRRLEQQECKQGGPLRDAGDADVLICGVPAVAHRAEPVQRRRIETRRVRVGSAADEAGVVQSDAE
jgi:hypothetical protein